MAVQTSPITFGSEQWSKGTRGGESRRWSDKARLRNMLRSPSGDLVPRPLWRGPEDPIVSNDANGSGPFIGGLYPLRYKTTGGNARNGLLCAYPGFAWELYYDNNTTYPFVDDSGAVAPECRVGGPAYQVSTLQWVIGGAFVDLTTADTLTLHDIGAAAATAFGLSGSATLLGAVSCVHQGRVFIWASPDDSIPRNRVYYSDSAITGGSSAYYTFSSASQYFDVDGDIGGCIPVGTQLYIFTLDGKWYTMSGAGDPATATFNYRGVGPVPYQGEQPRSLDTGAIFVAERDVRSVVTISPDNGINDTANLHIRDISGSSFDSPMIAAAHVANVVSVFGGYDSEGADVSGYENHNGVWYETTAPIDLAQYFQSPFANPSVHEHDTSGRIMGLSLTDVEFVGEDIYYSTFWRYRTLATSDYPEPNTSPVDSYTFAAEGLVELPRLSSPTKQVRVHSVVIDAVIHASDAVDNDYAEPNIAVWVVDGKDNETELQLGPGTDPLELTSENNRSVRIVATGAPNTFTAFSDVDLRDLRGLSITRVTVNLEESNGPIA